MRRLPKIVVLRFFLLQRNGDEERVEDGEKATADTMAIARMSETCVTGASQ